MESIIEELNLTEVQVLNIVLEWYTTMCIDNFETENGTDLEEFIEQKLYR